MHDHATFIALALLFLIFGLFSKISDRGVITAPMAFMVVGFLLGNESVSIVSLHITSEEVKFIAEVTLITILFVDASLIRFSTIKQIIAGVPGRLLGVGLPLSMAFGAIVAIWMFPNFGMWTALLIALILSPTDAALGQAVIKNTAIPEDIRRSISVESGLNDGIALPLILMCIAALAAASATANSEEHWLRFMLVQILLAPLAGALVGKVAGMAIDYASSKDWMSATFHQLAGIAMAILAYSFAESIGTNGFISAFFAGLFLGTQNKLARERITEYGEAQGSLFSLIVFFIFGASVVPHLIAYWDLQALIYAVLSLTIIRMLPVYISLLGTGVPAFSRLFIGWFGPRGIASVLYLLIVVIDLGPAGYEYALSIIVLTIVISVLAHGASAATLAKHYSK